VIEVLQTPGAGLSRLSGNLFKLESSDRYLGVWQQGESRWISSVDDIAEALEIFIAQEEGDVHARFLRGFVNNEYVGDITVAPDNERLILVPSPAIRTYWFFQDNLHAYIDYVQIQPVFTFDSATHTTETTIQILVQLHNLDADDDFPDIEMYLINEDGTAATSLETAQFTRTTTGYEVLAELSDARFVDWNRMRIDWLRVFLPNDEEVTLSREQWPLNEMETSLYISPYNMPQVTTRIEIDNADDDMRSHITSTNIVGRALESMYDGNSEISISQDLVHSELNWFEFRRRLQTGTMEVFISIFQQDPRNLRDDMLEDGWTELLKTALCQLEGSFCTADITILTTKISGDTPYVDNAPVVVTIANPVRTSSDDDELTDLETLTWQITAAMSVLWFFLFMFGIIGNFGSPDASLMSALRLLLCMVDVTTSAIFAVKLFRESDALRFAVVGALGLTFIVGLVFFVLFNRAWRMDTAMNTWLHESSSSVVVVLIFILSGGNLAVLKTLKCNLYNVFSAPFAQAHLDSLFRGILMTTVLQDVTVLGVLGYYIYNNADENLVVLFCGVSSLLAVAAILFDVCDYKTAPPRRGHHMKTDSMKRIPGMPANLDRRYSHQTDDDMVMIRTVAPAPRFTGEEREDSSIGSDDGGEIQTMQIDREDHDYFYGRRPTPNNSVRMLSATPNPHSYTGSVHSGLDTRSNLSHYSTRTSSRLQIFRLFDMRNNHEISYREFQSGLKKLGIMVTEEEAAKLFSEFDESTTGRIIYRDFASLIPKETTVAEFSSLIYRMLDRTENEPRGPVSLETFLLMAEYAGVHLPAEDVETVFRRLSNGRRMLKYDIFKAFLHVPQKSHVAEHVRLAFNDVDVENDAFFLQLGVDDETESVSTSIIYTDATVEEIIETSNCSEEIIENSGEIIENSEEIIENSEIDSDDEPKMKKLPGTGMVLPEALEVTGVEQFNGFYFLEEKLNCGRPMYKKESCDHCIRWYRRGWVIDERVREAASGAAVMLADIPHPAVPTSALWMVHVEKPDGTGRWERDETIQVTIVGSDNLPSARSLEQPNNGDFPDSSKRRIKGRRVSESMEEDFEIEIHGSNPGIVFEVGPKKKMLVVREVAPQSEGALGGVMRGDFLIAVDGVHGSPDSLLQLLQTQQPPFTMTFYRPRKIMSEAPISDLLNESSQPPSVPPIPLYRPS